jgi:ketol-acid reductoisomerase
MMTTIYKQADADPSLIQQRRVAVIGFGNQGRSQALNLRDSGVTVIVGNIDDDYRSRAMADGFQVVDISQAVREADVVMILLPDEVIPSVFANQIAPYLREGMVVSFASGYAVTYKTISIPTGIDIVLLAPRMIGEGVRQLYQSGEGFFSFLAVEQDATGSAWPVLLSLAHAVGTLRRGGVAVTFAIETELDLFNEQAFGPAFGRVLLTAIDTLVKAGYPREAVLLEFYLSGELSFILKDMAETGLIQQLDRHSQTSQYGALSRGMKFLGVNLGRPMRKILDNIRRGKFAREWSFEERTGKLRYRFFRMMAKRQPIGPMEDDVRRKLGMVA